MSDPELPHLEEEFLDWRRSIISWRTELGIRLAGILSPAVAHDMGAALMLYAQGLLPFLLRLSVLLIEPNAKSRRRMLPFLVIGGATTLLFCGRSRHPHCSYTSRGTVSCMSIKPRTIQRLANLAAIVLVVMAFKRYAFTSLWCAYAAVASVIILADAL